jgi:hypothetical protein
LISATKSAAVSAGLVSMKAATGVSVSATPSVAEMVVASPIWESVTPVSPSKKGPKRLAYGHGCRSPSRWCGEEFRVVRAHQQLGLVGVKACEQPIEGDKAGPLVAEDPIEPRPQGGLAPG